MVEPAAPKVSVLIPTYRSGRGLEVALASLDRQDLAQDEFEVLLLDDGSPDDTAARNAAIAAERPNYRALALEPSGWPSRPRNIGVREARGEFVFFLDHDDELFPRALSAAYELALRHDADVVNGKEVRTHKPVWGRGVYTSDRGPDGPDGADALPGRGLLPMTPHKLYRRSFLLEHDVRFPEGAGHLWEDVFFNTELLRHAPRVAVLGSVPSYHWRSTGENNSAATDGSRIDYGGHPDYWPYLDDLFALVTSLPDAALRDELLAHNTKVRLLALLGRPEHLGPAGDDDDVRAREELETRVLAALERWVPPTVDAVMRPRSRRAVALLRASRVAEAHALLGHGAHHTTTVATTRVASVPRPGAVDGAVVEVEATVRWVPGPDSSPDSGTAAARPLWERSGEGLRLRLPDGVHEALDDLGEDAASDPAAARVTLLARHRGSRAVWELPTTSRARVTPVPGGVDVELDVRAELDPATAAAGHPFVGGRWDLYAVVELDDRQWVPRLRDATDALPVDPEGGRPPQAPPGLRGPLFVPHRDADGRVTVVVHRPAAEAPSRGRRLAGRLRRGLGR